MGLLVILFGAVQIFRGENVEVAAVTAIAGIISEFIAGLALIIYRSTFTKLDETSRRLEESWRILMSYRLAENLSDERREDAVTQLVYKLAGISAPSTRDGE